MTEEIAFCSNVENIQAVEDGIYTAVTTSASNVDKLKALAVREKNEQILAYQQFSRLNQKYRAADDG